MESQQDFSKFKTYAWIESKHPGKGLWNQRIIDGVDTKLAKAGLKKVDASAKPDLEVVYNAGVKEHTVVEDYDYTYRPYGWYYGYRPWYGPRPITTQTYQEKEATLTVDLVDNSDKEMVWRGVAKILWPTVLTRTSRCSTRPWTSCLRISRRPKNRSNRLGKNANRNPIFAPWMGKGGVSSSV